jgi:CheY-like chemotaxis protein
LKVYSESGRGTLFKVLFPVAPGEPVRSAVEKSRNIRGGGTILVVEDDQAVEKIARALLEHFGFHVLSAVNGKEAVEIFRIKAAEIDAVLLDMSMPVMDGETALPLLLEIRPDARIILSSGFSEMEALQRFQNRGVTGFLQKPYSAERLKTLLAQIGIAREG